MGEAVDAVRLAVAALNAGDVDGYLQFFEPTCLRWVVGSRDPLNLGDVAAGLRDMHAAFDGLRLDEDLLFGDERFVCARWRMRGRHAREYLGMPPAGSSIDVETCEVYEVGPRRVVTSWVYGDVIGQLVQQIGGGGDDA